MRPRHLVGLVALSLIWGGSYLFNALALEGMEPVTIGWARMGGGSLFVLTVVLYRGLRWPRRRSDWGWLLLIALFSSAVPFVLIPWGQQHIDSGLTAVLISAMPLWVTVLAVAFVPSEGMTPVRVVGVAIGFAGVVLVIGFDSIALGLDGLRGQIAVLGASLCYAIGAVLVRGRRLPVDSTVVAGVQALLAFACLTPVAVAGGLPDPGTLPARSVFAVAMLAFGSSGVGFLIFYWLLGSVGATRASMVTYLVPVSALFWGWSILDERIAPLAVPGLALILLGIVLVNRPGGRRVTVEPEAHHAPAAARSGRAGYDASDDHEATVSPSPPR